MLTLEVIDMDELTMALDAHTDYESFWWLDPETGEIGFWSEVVSDDSGESADDLDERGIIRIDPITPSEGYLDMESFAAAVDDAHIREQLRHALDATHPFRRFKAAICHFPGVEERWFAHYNRAMRRRAIEWLVDAGVIDQVQTDLQEHP